MLFAFVHSLKWLPTYSFPWAAMTQNGRTKILDPSFGYALHHRRGSFVQDSRLNLRKIHNECFFEADSGLSRNAPLCPTAATPFAGSGLSWHAPLCPQRPPPLLGVACRGTYLCAPQRPLPSLEWLVAARTSVPDSGHSLRWEWLGTHLCAPQRPPLRWEWLVVACTLCARQQTPPSLGVACLGTHLCVRQPKSEAQYWINAHSSRLRGEVNIACCQRHNK